MNNEAKIQHFLDNNHGYISTPDFFDLNISKPMIKIYIFNLLLRIINVSIQTVDIVNSLPKLDFE